MLTAAQLKQITTEARPIIERMLEDAERLAGLRDVVAAAGGDWGQLKALIKAQIKDEHDEAGEGKHVRKILDKADYATAYADMLGLSAFSKMNEENFLAADIPHDAETGEIIEPSPAAQIAAGLTEALAVVKGEAEPYRVHQIPGNGAGSAETEASVANVGATASANPSQPSLRADTAAQTVQPDMAVVTSDAVPESVESTAGVGGGDKPPTHQSAVPLTQERGTTGDESAVIPSAALVAPDFSKPNPWCQDPDDCGVNASWNHTCGSCLRRKATIEAQGAVQ